MTWFCRFASTIVAQFNGHTHVDELRVFYSSTNTSSTEAFGVAFNGAAVTPWGTNSNPSFKYYTVDGSSCVSTFVVRRYHHQLVAGCTRLRRVYV